MSSFIKDSPSRPAGLHRRLAGFHLAGSPATLVETRSALEDLLLGFDVRPVCVSCPKNHLPASAARTWRGRRALIQIKTKQAEDGTQLTKAHCRCH